MDSLIFHELGHADIARNARKEIQKTVDEKEWVAKDEPALKKMLAKHCQTIVEDYRKKEDEYDADTDHGRTQGAVLRLRR